MPHDAVTTGEEQVRQGAHDRRDGHEMEEDGDRHETQRHSEPPALPHRPEAITLSVEDLLNQVHAGRIRVPDFQRAPRWKASDITLLLDSIYRGYPIGALLFSKGPAEAEVVRLGSITIDAPRRQDALWVVDGQQRIAALTGVLTGSYDDVAADHVLFFDLDAERFRRTGEQPPPRHWLPLDRVVDSAELLCWLHERDDALGEDAMAAAVQLGERVREYQVPAYVVETQDEQPLLQMFLRIHRGGNPLEDSNVFQAMHGGGAQRPAGLEDVGATLARTGFGSIDADIILEALLAIMDKEPGRALEDQLGSDEIPVALARTRSALERVIVFLRRDAGIPHVGLMPYRPPLVTLARFFHLHPEPAPRSLVLMARWLWRGAMTGRHHGNTVATRKALQAIGSDEARSVQSMLREVDPAPDVSLPLTPYNARYAQSRLQLLALWALGPRHLVTGAALRIEELMQSDTPAQPIEPPGKNDPKASHGLANRLLHPPLPGGLREPLVAQAEAAVWASHGITPEAHAALVGGDFAAFLRLREEHLGPHIERFLAARAQWGTSDRPHLAALVIDDD